jgi:putative salt-induced outer membrane protein YdiY
MWKYALIFGFIFAIQPAWTDEVRLQDGSRIIGKIAHIQDGIVQVNTEFAGAIKIDIKHVTGIITDEDHAISLDDQPPVQRRLNQIDQSTVVIDSSGNETAIILTSLTGLDVPEPPKWEGRAELGISGATGNSERFALLGRTEMTRKFDEDLLYFLFQADYEEDEGERTENEFLFATRYEWKTREKWYGFAKLALEHDEFEDLDLRSTLTIGARHDTYKSKRQQLISRMGIGYQREDFKTGDSQDQAIFDLGMDYRLEVSKWLRFTQDVAYLSVIDDPIDDYRAVFRTGAEVPIGNKEAWKIRMGVTNEYDNDPQPGVDHLDTKYTLNLIYDW